MKELSEEEIRKAIDEGPPVEEQPEVPPKPSLLKRIRYALTCWRPVTKYESDITRQAIVKLGEAIRVLSQTQDKLVKSNNSIVQQIRGQKMVDADKEDQEMMYQ